MSTIPASTIINVNPSVIGAGGSGLQILGLVLSSSTRIPIGVVEAFDGKAAVGEFFGTSSPEYLMTGSVYFNGYDNAPISPGSILFTQYNSNAVSAWIRGAPVVSLSIPQLQALNGTLSLIVDGYPRTANINLSSANSFSGAAALIQTGLNGSLSTLATVTGSIGGTVLTVTGVAGTALAAGQTLLGTGVAAGTQITGQLTGSAGGTGTYSVSISQIIGAESFTTQPSPVVASFDSISGGFQINSGVTGAVSTIGYASGTLGTSLLLTQATGAILSQGAAAASPAAFMNYLTQNITQGWATFMLGFDPDFGSGNSVKLAFAAWTAGTKSRYAFICWDTDPNPALSNNAPSSLGQLIAAAGYGGTSLWWDNVNNQSIAAFIAGTCASIAFNQANGRITIAFKAQDGLVPAVTNELTASNLQANGYNYYGAYATANQAFQWAYPGSVSGPYLFLDSYINQIWLNAQFQLALAELVSNIGAIPYNQPGYRTVENALSTPIQQGLTFGAYSAGVVLSGAQQQEVNTAAGANIAPTLFQQGWYLQVLDPGATARNNRQSPIVNFWYTDGEAVQQIQMNSTEVQ